jgi:hypothetical protein
MHGGPNTVYKNAQHEKAMQAPINPKKEPEYDPEFVDRVRRHM